jgi:hypothetical protein
MQKRFDEHFLVDDCGTACVETRPFACIRMVSGDSYSNHCYALVGKEA